MTDPVSDPTDPAAAGLDEARTPPAAPPPPRRWWRRWKLFLGLLLLTPVLLFALYTLMALNWSYSEGQRAGYVQKFSKKGWLCKTWEGELAMTTVPGIAPTIWAFTIRKEAAAKQMEIALGRRAVLFYREHRGIPTTCFGETGYFVDSIHIVK